MKENSIENSKKQFFDLYESAKSGKIDLLTLQPEVLKMMCDIVDDEIKVEENKIKNLKAKLNIS